MGYKFTRPTGYHYRPGMLFLGVDERGQEIGIDTRRHALTVAGSGAGKGAAILIPNAKRWTQNLLVIDPKGEVVANSWQEREALGQRVAVLDPFGVAKIPDRLRARFNPLAEIDGDTEWARSMIRAIADGLIISYNSEHMEFTKASRAIWAGLLSYVTAEAPPEKRNFATARDLLMEPDEELYNTAQIMAGSEGFGGMIRDAGVLIISALKSDKGLEKSAIGTARTATLWLDEPKVKAALDGQSFTLSDLRNGALSLYLVLPPGKIADYAGFLRLFVKTALRTMSEELAIHDDETTPQRRCLFMLDEFYSLGKLDDITEAVGLMRGYGVQLWPFVQNFSQIVELYGKEAVRNYFENSDADIFMGTREHESLKYVSDRIGMLTPDEIGVQPPELGFNRYAGQSVTISGSSHNLGETEGNEINRRYTNQKAHYDHAMRMVGTPRITPQEVEQTISMPDSRNPARSMIVFARGSDVLNLGLAPHFKKTRSTAPVTRFTYQEPSPVIEAAPASAQTVLTEEESKLYGYFSLVILFSTFLWILFQYQLIFEPYKIKQSEISTVKGYVITGWFIIAFLCRNLIKYTCLFCVVVAIKISSFILNYAVIPTVLFILAPWNRRREKAQQEKAYWDKFRKEFPGTPISAFALTPEEIANIQPMPRCFQESLSRLIPAPKYDPAKRIEFKFES